MCAIAGMLTSGAPPPAEVLADMASRLAHRGPDDQGQHVEGPLGFVHTRLSIIDLQGGHQPLFNADRSLALVVNGEIYNYVELTEELTLLGHQFRTHSDSETILHAYAQWGIDFLQRLHGMFALALYDSRLKRLILARDRLGMKPLYVLRQRERLLFASEMKALLPQLPTIEFAAPALAQYLADDVSAGRDTAIAGVQRVLPGQALVVDAVLGVQEIEYWSALAVKPRSGSQQDFEEEFEALMQRVMREHLRADVPIALFLSGGVDSSLLLALMAQHAPKPLHSFSVSFSDDAERSEAQAAAFAAARFGAVHTPLEISGGALLSRFAHMVWAADEPMLDHAMLPTSLLAQQVARQFKVVITGEGGDEAFAGYGRYRRHALQRLLRSIGAPGSGGYRTRSHWPRAVAQKVFAPTLLAARAHEKDELRRAWQAAPANWSALQHAQYVDMRTLLPDSLNLKVDRMLMGFGLEGRVPFLDHRVIEFGLALPDALKVAAGQGKLFLKAWGLRHYPAEHLQRKKRGFSVPMKQYLSGALLDEVARRLPANPLIAQWFRADGIAWLAARQRGHGDMAHALWALVQLAVWQRIFIEGDGVAPPLESELPEWIAAA